jgi:hypothetical protein
MQDRLTLKKTFSTSDLALATAISIWLPLKEVDRSQDLHRAFFIFDRTEKLNDIVDKYWKKELLVEPRQYFDQLKALKGRLYSHE